MGINDQLKVMIPALMLGHQLPSEMKLNQSIIIDLMLYRYLKNKQTILSDANKLLNIKEYSLH